MAEFIRKRKVGRPKETWWKVLMRECNACVAERKCVEDENAAEGIHTILMSIMGLTTLYCHTMYKTFFIKLYNSAKSMSSRFWLKPNTFPLSSYPVQLCPWLLRTVSRRHAILCKTPEIVCEIPPIVFSDATLTCITVTAHW